MFQYRNILRWLWRELRITALATVTGALLSGPFTDQTLDANLIYSLTVTLCIQALIEAGRYGLSARPGKRLPDEYSDGTQRRWPGWRLMAPWVLMSVVLGYLLGHVLGDLLTGVHRSPLAFLHDHMVELLPALGPAFACALGLTYFFYARGRIATMEPLSTTTAR